MDVVHYSSLTGAKQTHRAGGINIKRLFKGVAGQPNNFEWSVVEMGPEYKTPRHRHNFSQLILVLEGEHEWLPKATRHPGALVYISEGASYGPQVGSGATLLTLQFGEASRNGFMDYAALAEGQAELAKHGTFESGVYTRIDDAGGKHNQDSYEAIWEFVNKRELVYPTPRYNEPVTVNTDAFLWEDVPGHAGVASKHLGTFTECRTAATLFKFEPGTKLTLSIGRAPGLLFVLKGQLTVGGHKLVKYSAAKIEQNEIASIAANEQAEIITIDLPTL